MSTINFCETKEQLNHLGEVVTGKTNGSPSGADIETSTLPYTGQVRKTLPALEDEYQADIDNFVQVSDQLIVDKTAEFDTSIANKEVEADAAFETQRNQFDATFQAQFAYKRIGNISLYVGDSLPEVDKLNSYQYPDDSGEWYGPVQDQAFPITIPADPSSDNEWALVDSLTSDSLPLYTDIAYKASGGNSAVENMLAGVPITASVGDRCNTGGTQWERVSNSAGDITDFIALSEVSINDFGALAGLGDSSSAIQLALDTGYSVTGSKGSYNCQSEISINNQAQIFDGKDKYSFILDFSAGGKINGIVMGRDAGASRAQLKNMRLIGASDADTDRNAGILVKNWTRGAVYDVQVEFFGVGQSWEGATLGHANSMFNIYYWRNRVAQVYLSGGNHATNFVGGELAQGYYGAVIGRLNADGTIDDDFGGNTGGNPTFFGTIIEGQSRTSLSICNGQLGVTFDGYFESSAIQDNFVRIGSQFKNDGITAATAVPKGIHIRGHAGVNTGVAAFPAVKMGAVVGGSCSLMCSGDNIIGLDTTECRFSTNFSTDGMWVSSGKYLADSDSNTTVSADIYPNTKGGGAYSRRFMTWSPSNTGYRASITIPRGFDLPVSVDSESYGKVLSLRADGVEVGYFESSSGGRCNWISGGTVSKWSTSAQGVQQIDFGAGKTFTATVDNAVSCGYGAIRWSEIFAVNGTINTSDERHKKLSSIDEAEKSCAIEVKESIKKFKWNDAIDCKGEDNARIHFGVGAQTVGEIFKSHGLAPDKYALFCYDEWGEVRGDDGSITQEAGDRYGIRYTELLMFIMSAL